MGIFKQIKKTKIFQELLMQLQNILQGQEAQLQTSNLAIQLRQV